MKEKTNQPHFFKNTVSIRGGSVSQYEKFCPNKDI